jgi:drug/metabolite transporter (DMT)-like permease
VAIITLAEPLASAILAYMVLSEMPSRAVLLGGLLILAGIYLASRPGGPRLAQIPPGGAA